MNMKNFAATALLLVLAGCNQKEAADKSGPAYEPVTDQPTIKVYVAAKGKILADGQQTTPEKLDQDLVKLAKDSGIVYFSRANAHGDGPVESMQVIESVMKTGVAIKFYTDSTFTQAVNMDGQPQ